MASYRIHVEDPDGDDVVMEVQAASKAAAVRLAALELREHPQGRAWPPPVEVK